MTNQQKWLKVKGDSTLPHSPPPAPPPDEFKAAASIIYFLSFSTLYMVESTRINAAHEVKRGGGGKRKTPKPADTVSLKFYFRTVNAVF